MTLSLVKGRQGEQSGGCVPGRWNDDRGRGRQDGSSVQTIKVHGYQRAADFSRKDDIRKACRTEDRIEDSHV